MELYGKTEGLVINKVQEWDSIKLFRKQFLKK